MPQFEVAIYRQVQDITRAFVTVEADDEDAAVAKVRERVEDGEIDPEFDFWQCGEICCGATDCHDDYYEASPSSLTDLARRLVGHEQKFASS